MTSGKRPAGATRGANCSLGDCWERQAVNVVFPALAQACWRGRTSPHRQADQAGEEALGLLFRLLLLFYADARGKLPAASRDELARWRLEAADQQPGRGQPPRFARAASDGRSIGARLDALGATLGSGGTLFGDSPDSRSFAASPLDDVCLAAAIDGLSRVGGPGAGASQFVDYAELSVRRLGSIYERLLEFRLEAGEAESTGKTRRAPKDRTRRKSGGCFYTPEPIIERILETTVGPALEQKLTALAAEFPFVAGESGWRRANLSAADTKRLAQTFFDRLFTFRLLDPAMGSGHFLLAAADFLAARIADFLGDVPADLVSESLQRALRPSADQRERRRGAATAAPDLRSALKQFAIERCLFGIDVDPRAVQLAKACLWLEAPLAGRCGPLFERSLRHGDALRQTRWEDFPPWGEFDAVIGNPPYGAKLQPAARKELARTLPLMKSNSDTAAGFIERASQWAGPQGRVGLIVPKSLTYSYAWRDVRRFLRGRLEQLVDVSRAWPEVRLEQAIIVFGGEATSGGYQSAWSESGRIVPGDRMTWALADRFETLPCALSTGELQRLAALDFSATSVGDVCRTFRGLPAQRQLGGEQGPPVIGGRDLERWRIRGSSGRLPASASYSLDAFRCEKLVFQNIIAHVSRPQPRILLIGAYDDRQTVTLDTVNNLAATDRRVNLLGLLGLLHSELINWLVYGVIYNKAIRTMHFDQYFLDKIPLPREWTALLERLAPAAKCCIAARAGLAELARRVVESPRPEANSRPLNESAALALLLGAGPRARRAAAADAPAESEAWRRLRAEALQLAEQRRQAKSRIDRLVATAYGDRVAQRCDETDGGAAAVELRDVSRPAGLPDAAARGRRAVIG